MAAPSQNKEQPDCKRVVGFDCEFLEPPPEHLLQSECPVCLQIIREPHQVTCCGNSFCYSCIQQVKYDNKPCPTCNQEGLSDFSDKRLKRSLYALKFDVATRKTGVSGRENWDSWMSTLTQIHCQRNNSKDVHLSSLIACIIAGTNCSEDTLKTTKLIVVANFRSIVSTAIITSLPLMMSPTTTGLCVGHSLSPALTSVVQLSNVRT